MLGCDAGRAAYGENLKECALRIACHTLAYFFESGTKTFLYEVHDIIIYANSADEHKKRGVSAHGADGKIKSLPADEWKGAGCKCLVQPRCAAVGKGCK